MVARALLYACNNMFRVLVACCYVSWVVSRVLLGWMVSSALIGDNKVFSMFSRVLLGDSRVSWVVARALLCWY